MKIRERKTLNKPLLRKLALKLRRLRHEEHYNQETWGARTACGTAACLAGHTVLLAGGKFDFDPLSYDAVACRMAPKANLTAIGWTARRLLGLPEVSEFPLFTPDPDEYWPEPYAQRWAAVKAGDSKERPSHIAADLLDAIADGKVKP